MPYRYGEKHHNSILTDDQVCEIRGRHMAYVRGRGYNALAREYGVSAESIRDICTYRTRRSAAG